MTQGSGPSIQLWLASTNPGKLREFAEAALARGVRVKSHPSIDRLPPCVEDGLTFAENARKKAAHYSRDFDGLVFADDSGIAVDALGGAPGVFSARFAGADATDEANNAKLIAELDRVLRAGGWGRTGLRCGARTSPDVDARAAAQYVCVIALARRGRIMAATEGRAEGVIIPHPRGSGGFGYDPYFFYPPLDRTFAELSPEAKFAVSHRGQAFRKLLDQLDRLHSAGPDTLSHEGELPVLS